MAMIEKAYGSKAEVCHVQVPLLLRLRPCMDSEETEEAFLKYIEFEFLLDGKKRL